MNTQENLINLKPQILSCHLRSYNIQWNLYLKKLSMKRNILWNYEIFIQKCFLLCNFSTINLKTIINCKLYIS